MILLTFSLCLDNKNTKGHIPFSILRLFPEMLTSLSRNLFLVEEYNLCISLEVKLLGVCVSAYVYVCVCDAYIHNFNKNHN